MVQWRSVRSGSPFPRHRRTRLAGWWLPLLLVGSCLNPQPDPFPQVDDSSRFSPEQSPVPVVAMPAVEDDRAGAGAAAAPPAARPSSPTPNGLQNSGAAEAPGDAADAGAPSPDAGADAGADDDALVGSD